MTTPIFCWPCRVRYEPEATHSTRHVSNQDKDQFISILVLLDLGSELLFISEELIHQLKLSRKSAIPFRISINLFRTHYVPFVLHFSPRKMYTIYFTILYSSLVNFYDTIIRSGWLWIQFSVRGLAKLFNFDKPGPIHIIVGADSYYCWRRFLRPDY